MSFKKSIISGTKWSSLSKIIRALFLLLQITILTRYLGKEDFGMVAMCMFIVNFTNIFVDAGFTSAILFKNEIKPKELSTLYWTNLLLAIFLFILLFLLTPIIADFYNEKRLLEYLPLLASNVIFIALGRLHLTVMQKHLKFKAIAIIDILSVFLGLIIATILAILNYGIYSLIISTLVVNIFSSLLGLILSWKENEITFHFRFGDLNGYFNVGGYSLAGQLLGFLITEIDTLIVGKLLGASSLGIYDLAKNIASKFYSIISPIISRVLTPLLAQMQNHTENLKYYFIKVSYLVSYLTAPLYLIIIIGSKELLMIMYGPEYNVGYIVLSFMAIFYCINSIYNPINSLQIATGKTKLGFFWALLCLLIYPIGIFISSPYGINAVAFVRSLISVMLVYMMWKIQVKKMLDISWREFINIFYKPLLLAISTGGVFLYFKLGLNSNYIYGNLLINAFVGICIFTCVIYIIDRKNVTMLYNQLREILLKNK